MNLHFLSLATFATVVPETVPCWWMASGDVYRVYAGVEPFVFGSLIDLPEEVAAFEAEGGIKSRANATEVAVEADAMALALHYIRTKTDEAGRSVVVPEPRTGTELIMVTHNFCDPTTWFSTSVRVTQEALTDSGDGLTFNSAHPTWIDMVHGKVFDEDALCRDVVHGYSVVVRVDGVEMTARAPFATSGGDYTIDYENGKITFAVSQSGKAVDASYSYAVDSTFILTPDPGKLIDIESAEAQFSANVEMNDTIDFEIWAYNPADLPNRMMMDISSYKTMTNFVDEAMGSYPVVPAIGGAAGRGTTHEIYGFPFRYGTVRSLDSSMGIELHVKLRSDQKFGGQHATATFYCTVRDI